MNSTVYIDNQIYSLMDKTIRERVEKITDIKDKTVNNVVGQLWNNGEEELAKDFEEEISVVKDSLY